MLRLKLPSAVFLIGGHLGGQSAGASHHPEHNPKGYAGAEGSFA
jgi:hypothetical protein